MGGEQASVWKPVPFHLLVSRTGDRSPDSVKYRSHRQIVNESVAGEEHKSLIPRHVAAVATDRGASPSHLGDPALRDRTS
jgi:hypothetical protein